ncbi:MAG: dockerin type I domain-containing protein [Pirellulales bacterium]
MLGRRSSRGRGRVTGGRNRDRGRIEPASRRPGGNYRRSLEFQALEVRQLLAADIALIGTQIVLTDSVAGGSENSVVMDYRNGELSIADASGLTSFDILAPFVVNDVLLMSADQLKFLAVSEVVLNTGGLNDSIVLTGSPDPSAVPTYVRTQVQAGAGSDLVGFVSDGTGDSALASPVSVDGGQPQEADRMTLGTTIGNDTIHIQSGATEGSGQILYGPSSGIATPIEFVHVSRIDVDESKLGSSTGGVDDLTVVGTESSDSITFESSASGEGTITIAGKLTINYTALSVDATIGLDGRGGNDLFTLIGPLDDVAVTGGPDLVGDRLTIQVAGTDTTQVDVEAQSITLSNSIVDYRGVELISLAGAGGSLVYQGLQSHDDLTYIPTSLTGGTVINLAQGALGEPVPEVRFSSFEGVLDLNTGAGDDELTVAGTPGADSMSVVRAESTEVRISDRKTVAIRSAETESLVVAGYEGDDTFTVGGTGGPASLLIDGGQPTASDTLIISDPTVTVNFGVDPSSGVIKTSGGDVPFTGIERIELIGDGTGALTVNATNGDDAINLTAAAITVNHGAVVNYSGYPILTLDALAGSDQIALNQLQELTGVSTIKVEGGDPTVAGDGLLVTGSQANEQVDYRPNGAGGGTIQVRTVTGGVLSAAPLVEFTTIESVAYDGVGGTDRLVYTTPAAGADGSTLRFRPGSAPDAGQLTGYRKNVAQPAGDLAPLTFVRLGAGEVSLETANSTPADRLEIEGTPLNDRYVSPDSNSVQIQQTGIGRVTPVLRMNAAVPVTLLGLAGDDFFGVSNSLQRVSVVGGENSSGDVVAFNAPSGDATVINVEDQSITAASGAKLNYQSVETVVINGASSLLKYQGLSTGDDITYVPTAASAGTITNSSVTNPGSQQIPAVQFSGITGLLDVRTGDGDDRVTVAGTSGGDTVAISRAATTTVLVNGFKVINLSGTETESLVVAGYEGDDTFTVGGTGGPASLLIGGGQPTASDTLIISDPTVTVNYGVDPSSGVIRTSGGDVPFTGIERIELIGDGTGALTVNATNGDDAINLTAAAITVNHGAVVNYSGYPILTLDALAGSDQIALNQLQELTGVSTIKVEGGDPTVAGDGLLVTGSQANEQVDYRPNGAGGGTIQVRTVTGGVLSAAPLVEFTTIESVAYDGVGGTDRLVYTTPAAGADGSTLRFRPGSAPDAGQLTGYRKNVAQPAGDLAPLTFVRLGAGEVSLETANSTPADRLEIEGTPLNDRYVSPDSNSVQIQQTGIGRVTPVLRMNAAVPVKLLGLAGDDFFGVSNSLQRVSVVGGENSSGDVVAFNAPSADATVINVEDQSITAASGAKWNYQSVETVVINGASSQLKYQGLSTGDDITYIPTAASAGTLTNKSVTNPDGQQVPAVHFNGITGLLDVRTGDGDDRVTVAGTSGGDTLAILRGATTTVQVNGFKVINLSSAETESLVVAGNEGDDAFTVGGTGGPASLLLDGGQPTASDTLIISDPTVTVSYGVDPSGGVIQGSRGEVPFTGIERIQLTGDDTGTLTVNGTNADDAINLNGPSLSVNQGAAVNFSGYSSLVLNGLAGNDQISLRDLQRLSTVTSISVDGGDPTATGDLLVVSGSDVNERVDYQPNGVGGGSIRVRTNIGGSLSPAPTVAFGAIEAVTYDGVDGNDQLVYTTPTNLGQGNTLRFIPGSAPDAGQLLGYAANPPLIGGELIALTFQNLGSGEISLQTANSTPRDRLEIQGTAMNDRFLSPFADAIQIERFFIGPVTPVLRIAGARVVSLQGLAGDDYFAVTNTFDRVDVVGGENSEGDVLVYSAPAADATKVNLATESIIASDGKDFTYKSVETIVVNGNSGSLEYDGLTDADDITYIPTSASGGTITNTSIPNTLGQKVPVVHFNNVTGSFQVRTGSGDDRLTVVGTQSGESIDVTRGSSPTVQVGNLKTVSFSSAETESLFVTAGLGDDNVNVHGSGGPASIMVDGGPPSASDTLTISNPTVTVSYGTDPSSGVVTTTSGDVMFAAIEKINLSGDGTGNLTVNGTNGDDAINLSGNTISVNNGAVVNFAGTPNGYANVFLNGRAGDDHTHLASLNTTSGVSQITTDGADGTSGDRLTMAASAGKDNLTFTPLSANSAQLAGFGNGLLVLALATESVAIDGQGGDDALGIATTATDNKVRVAPGSTDDAGSVQVDSLVPLLFANLGSLGALTINDVGGNDVLEVFGTSVDDTFRVPNAGIAGNSVGLNSRVPINTVNVENYALKGLSGADSFHIIPRAEVAISVAGDGTSDRLIFTRDSGGDANVSVLLDADLTGATGSQVISQTGRGPVTHSGVTTAVINVNTGNLVVSGTRFDDTLSYSPLGPDSGSFTADQVPTRYQFAGVPAANTFRITGGGTGTGGPTGGGFADRVVVAGTSGSDLMRVDRQARRVDLAIQGFGFPPPILESWRSVTLDDGTSTVGVPGIIETVELRGEDGQDTFYAAPGAAVGNGLYIDISGGSDRNNDALVVARLDELGRPINLLPTTFVVVDKSREADSGNIVVYENAVRQPTISYENVEVVSPKVQTIGGNPNLLILGPDLYEQNESRRNAAFLGSAANVRVENLAISPNSSEFNGVNADVDYFRVLAETTGILDLQVYFDTYSTTLLPAGGNLRIQLLDDAGTVLADSATDKFSVDGPAGDARIRMPVVAGQSYYLVVTGSDPDVINGYDLTVTNTPLPVPFDIELQDLPVDSTYDCTQGVPGDNSDTGRSQFDNVTCDASPTVWIRVDDSSLLIDPGSAPIGSVPIPFNPSTSTTPSTPGFRIAVLDEGAPQQPGISSQQVIGYAQPGGVPGLYIFNFDDAVVPTAKVLTDGSHFISARVELTGGAAPSQFGYGIQSQSMEIVVDKQPPTVDITGIVKEDDCEFTPEGMTSDTTPELFGYAEANSLVRIYLDLNQNDTLELDTDLLLGEAVAIPTDGTNQFPRGYWTFQVPIDLMDPSLGLPPDGWRTLMATAEDLAGNVTPQPDIFRLSVDTDGPQITSMFITTDPDFDLFDTKPSVGPTPLVSQISLRVRDLPNRYSPDLLAPALVESIAENPGHYRVVGDANGIVDIKEIQYIDDPRVNGQPATGTIIITFTQPLPDDRFTLTVADNLIDPVCNNLDGESNADEPQDPPAFPTGDGIVGGKFVARFTVDSRPELGYWAAGNVWVDTNGNFKFDPTNVDFTNRDITYSLGYTSDDVFAGNFVAGAQTRADGFDKLAAYGRVDNSWRWLIDTNNDGVPDISRIDPLGINGIPVAGNFDGNSGNGDEVGLFTGTTWYLDRNHDFRVDLPGITTSMRGYPVVGDFNGDRADDLGTWADDTFAIDFGPIQSTSGADQQFKFGFIGTRERPVAADFDKDGVDDLGLWVPDRTGNVPVEGTEWYILISGGNKQWLSNSPQGRVHVDPVTSQKVIDFTPVPFGKDLYAHLGEQFALPVVGNFDPPVATAASSGGEETVPDPRDPRDVNNDSNISPVDALLVINYLSRQQSGRLENVAANGPFLDVNGDGYVSPVDALAVINYLNQQARLSRSAAAAPVPAPASLTAEVMAQAPAAAPPADSGEVADQPASESQASSTRSSTVDLLMGIGVTSEDILSPVALATNPFNSKSRAKRIDELFGEW